MKKIQKRVGEFRGFLRGGLWTDPSTSRWLVARAISLLQFAVMTAEGFVRDRLLLQAGALSYFTVISLIPIIAIAIAIAAAIGIDSSFAEQIVDKVAAGAPEGPAKPVEQTNDPGAEKNGAAHAGATA